MPPPNDNLADAELITIPSTVAGTTVGATTEPDDYGEPNVWYRFELAAPVYVRMTLSGADGFRPYAEVFGPRIAVPVVWQDIDWVGDGWWEAGVGGEPRTALVALPAGTFYLNVMDWDFDQSSTGDFTMELSTKEIESSDITFARDFRVADPEDDFGLGIALEQYQVGFLQIADYWEHAEGADFDIRKQLTPPLNDDYADRRYFSNNPIAICPNDLPWDANTNLNANAEPDEPDHAGFPAKRSIWYVWGTGYTWDTPKAGVEFDIWIERTYPGVPLEDDYVLSVYSGLAPSVAELGPELASDDNSGPDDQPFLTLTATGEPLVICVDSKGLGGRFSLRAAMHVTATAPLNDEFGNRIVLAGSAGSIAGTTVGATYECDSPYWPYDPNSGFPTQPRGGDIWYEFTAFGGDYTLSWESDDQVRIGVYVPYVAGSVPTNSGQLTPYAPFGGAGVVVSHSPGSVTFGVEIGTTYYVRVEHAAVDQQAGTADIEFVWDTPPPTDPSDNYDDAIEVPVPDDGGAYDYDFDLTGAGQQPDEPLDKAGQRIRSVWRKFIPKHDCTYMMRFGDDGAYPQGHNVDVWRGTVLGKLDLLPLGTINTRSLPGASGIVTWQAVRMRKGETYQIRHSSDKSVPPASHEVNVRVDYEMDKPWTDVDGWDEETGFSFYEDEVMTCSELGYRTVTPWVGERSCQSVWISFRMRILSDFSPTAADGPVLGRHYGPGEGSHPAFYPPAGNQIGILRLNGLRYGSPASTGLSIVGDSNGDARLDLGGTTLWNNFGLPNSEHEGGEFILVELTPMGTYINGRYVAEGMVGLEIESIDWGAYAMPIDTFWGEYGPPETWTLQIQDMRVTDRWVDGPLVHPGRMIQEFDTRIGAQPYNEVISGGAYPSPQQYPALAFFDMLGETPSWHYGNPHDYQVENPTDREWDCVRFHGHAGQWQLKHLDNPVRHSGFWVHFDEWPGGITHPYAYVVISAFQDWTGTSAGYFNDLCRLEVNDLGELWIYPFRNWRRYDNSPFVRSYVYDKDNKKQLIGRMSLGEWYWIEIQLDFTFPWDAKMRVAVNDVECQPIYEGVLNQVMGNVAQARYEGSVLLFEYRDQAIGAPAGSPVNNNLEYEGHVDLHIGPWFIGRGGQAKYKIGPHAGAMIPVGSDHPTIPGRDGIHKVLKPDDLEYFTNGGDDGTPGFFEYAGIRFYGAKPDSLGSKGGEVSLNHDFSAGTTGYAASGRAGQPSLPVTVVSDGSGPPGHAGEGALEVAHDPSGPGGSDFVYFGGTWEWRYQHVIPPTGVREGGPPDDDGGDNILMIGYARAVGPGPVYMDAFDGPQGDVGMGPTYLFSDNAWHRIWGASYVNIQQGESYTAGSHWQFDNLAGSVMHLKNIRVFRNALVYPRFKTSSDNGASSNWVEQPGSPVASYLNDDPFEDTDLCVFMDNVCPFERFHRTAWDVPWIIGYFPTGISLGDYRHRRYVEIKTATEEELEDTNVKPSALRVIVRAAGYGVNDAWGDITTARTGGVLKVRMTHGVVQHVINDFSVSNEDRPYASGCLPMTPSGFQWTMFSISETTIRLGFHFGYSTLSLNGSYGARIHQSGAGLCKAVAYELFCETEPGPPICGGGLWKGRLTKKI